MSFVLVVDDKSEQREDVREAVLRLGYEVRDVASVDDAKEILSSDRQGEVDFVVTDLRLPNNAAEGRELMRWIDAQKPLLRYGVYSAYIEDYDPRVGKAVFCLDKAGKSGGIHALRRDLRRFLSDYPLTGLAPGSWNDVTLGERPAQAWSVERSAFASTDDSPPRAIVRFEMDRVRWREVHTDQGLFHEVDAPGLRSFEAPAQPALLSATTRVALPGVPSRIDARAFDERWEPIEGSFRLLPVPRPTLTGDPMDYVVDAATYRLNQILSPEAVGVRPIETDGVACAFVSLRVTRHNPRTGTLEVLRSARVEIVAVPVLSPSIAPRPYPQSPLRDLVLDWERACPGDLPVATEAQHTIAVAATAGGGAHPGLRRYVVVGNAAGIEGTSPLRQARADQFIVTTAEIGRDIPVPSEAQKADAIREYLRKLTSNPSTRPSHVLLVGGDDVVPYVRFPKYADTSNPKVQGVPLLSDQWYAGFKHGGSMPTVEFALGRLPISDSAALRRMSEKAAVAGGAWQHWLVVAGTESEHQLDVHRRFSESHPRLVDHRRIDGDATPASKARIDAAIRDKPTFTTYRGHGLRPDWVLDRQAQNRWRYAERGVGGVPIDGVISIACCTAALDSPPSHCGSCVKTDHCNQTDHSMGGDWIANGGAAWFLGSTRISWHAPNDEFHGFLMEAILKDGCEDIGTVFRRALIRLLESPRTGVVDNVAMAVLLGDPASPIHAGPPSET